MALSFNGLEPVTFGSKECVPKITSETELKLSQVKKYDKETDEILASAFPEDEEYVKGFLDNMTMIDKQILHAYLVGGDTLVTTTMEQIKGALKNA